jgi:hypothetical protein
MRLRWRGVGAHAYAYSPLLPRLARDSAFYTTHYGHHAHLIGCWKEEGEPRHTVGCDDIVPSDECRRGLVGQHSLHLCQLRDSAAGRTSDCMLRLSRTVAVRMQPHSCVGCCSGRVRCGGTRAGRMGKLCGYTTLCGVSPVCSTAGFHPSKVEWDPPAEESRREWSISLVPFDGPCAGLLEARWATRHHVPSHRSSGAYLPPAACRESEGASQPRGERTSCRCVCEENEGPVGP